jgi:hypothetical protein
MGGEMAVVVTVAAMFMIPAALRRRDGDGWPAGDMGAVLDGAILIALAAMCAWVAWSVWKWEFY